MFGAQPNYVTGRNNRLQSDGIYTYAYDDEGNLIQKTEITTGKTREFVWDYRNRLVSVIDEDSTGVVTQQVDYTYDAIGRRLSKAIDWDGAGSGTATTTHFVYDRDNVLLEFTNNALSQRYLHGTRVDQVLAQESGSGETIWHLTDHLGTVRDLVDERGEVVNHLKYDSFGQIVSQTNEVIGSHYQFTGREFDVETGLHYYRARYYDANVGRFISEDPIGFESRDVNLYRYVTNSPLDRIDPSGLYGIVLDQDRLISYEDNGTKYTNTIVDVIAASRRNARVSILDDETTAISRLFPN